MSGLYADQAQFVLTGKRHEPVSKLNLPAQQRRRQQPDHLILSLRPSWRSNQVNAGWAQGRLSLR